MIINFTEQELAQLKAIEDSYDRLMETQQQLIEKLRPGDNGPDEALYNAIQNRRPKHPEPAGYTEDGQPYYKKEDLEPYQKANDAINKEIDDLFNAWEAAGEPAWRKAREKLRSLMQQKSEAITGYIEECELRQFKEIGDDPKAIFDDAIYQVTENLERRFTYYKEKSEGGSFSAFDVRATDDGFYLDTDAVIESFSNILRLHFRYFETTDRLSLIELKATIENIVETSPYTSRTEGIKGAYVVSHETTKKSYRSRTEAVGRITKYPEAYITPTLSGYQNAVSLHQDGNAYLQPLITTDNLQFRDGKLYFKGKIEQISEVELQDMKTKQGIEEINLLLLGSYYGIILNSFYDKLSKKEKLSPVIKLYIPELAAYMGRKTNLHKDEIQALIKDTQSFHNIIGVEHITRNGKPDKSYWPLLNFEGYDAKENSISFSSPYINHIVETIYKQSIRKDKKGSAKLKKDGKTPLTLPSHSYLIKGSIAAERNKEAAQNVIIIVDIIERAGKNTPHFRIQTIIDRNPQLKERLENSSNQVQLLRRVFTKTWELLRKQTLLEEAYNNIKLPDPKDPAVIPTVKTLEDMVIEIPHEGKKRK